jgi:hypothetical protein
MIVVPGKFCYVLTPRTGSRAMEQAFLSHVPGAQDVGRHHGYEVGYMEPVYATIRNPCMQLLSHYWKVRDEMSFKDYLNSRTPRLNHHKANRYFIFEHGLERIFEQLGYSDIKVPHVGKSNADINILTEENIMLINKLFKEDVVLYESVVNA